MGEPNEGFYSKGIIYGYYYNHYYYYKNKSVRKPGVMGLKNLNASLCYMNASIQCLVHLEPFYTSIKSLNKKTKKSLVYEISNFIEEMMNEENKQKSYSPKNIIIAMGKIDEKYLENRQRDANEFISNCIMGIHDETKEPIEKININTQNSPQDQMEKSAYENVINKFYSKNDSFIIDDFYGNFIDEVICQNYHHPINIKFQPYNMIELPVINCFKYVKGVHDEKYTVDLYEVLNKFIQPKKSSETKLKLCPKCKKEVEISRTRKIYSIPNCLILYLNNCVDGYYNNIILKPPKKLDMSKYMKGANQSVNFSLVGAIEYWGTGKRGHYIAKCYNFKDDKWYLFYDEYVDVIKVEDIYCPIILFYEKKTK